MEERPGAGEVNNSMRDMRVKIFITITILLLVQTGQAEEADYGLLWGYEISDSVWGVSVSSDGSYIAAGSGDAKVYFFASDADCSSVPNEVGFVPTINNYHIYAGAGILLAGLVLTIRAGLKRKENIRLERQREDDERCREQEHKERMKQESLNMIEEVTKGER